MWLSHVIHLFYNKNIYEIILWVASFSEVGTIFGYFFLWKIRQNNLFIYKFFTRNNLLEKNLAKQDNKKFFIHSNICKTHDPYFLCFNPIFSELIKYFRRLLHHYKLE